MHEQLSKHRIFVGGLFSSVTEQDIREKFRNFGEVTDVELKQRKDEDGNATKTFAYVNLLSKVPAINKCFALFGGTKWKGHELKVQLAKEDFIERLRKERLDPNYYEKTSRKQKAAMLKKSYDDIVLKTTKMKKPIPGTMVEGERDWVIGKYGRPLPVVSIKPRFGTKLMKFDPSKHCHCLKRISDDHPFENNIGDLIWYSNEKSGNIHTKTKHKREMQTEDFNDKELSNDEQSSYEPSKKKKLKMRKHGERELQNEDFNDKASSNDEQSSKEPSKKKKLKKRKHVESELKNEDFNDKASSNDEQSSKEPSKKKKLKKRKHVDSELKNEDFNDNESSNGEQSSNEPSKKKKLKKRKHRNSVVHEDVEIENYKEGETSDPDRVKRVDIQYADVDEKNIPVDVKNEISCLSVSIVEQLNEKLTSKQIADKSIDENMVDKSFDTFPGSMFDFDFYSLQGDSDGKQLNAPLNPTDIDSTIIRDGKLNLSSYQQKASDPDPLSETTENILSVNEDMAVVEVSENLKNKKTDGDLSNEKHAKRTENSKKKLMSEEARKNSVEKRTKKNLLLKETVSAALKQVDTPTSCANRIVFQESSDEDVGNTGDNDHVSEQTDGLQGNVSGVLTDNSVKCNKKDLFGGLDSDEDEDDDNENFFEIKAQFQGKRGEELFKMQQRFGGDVRFQMDKRFADNDMADEPSADQGETRRDVSDKNEEATIDSDECVKKEKHHNLAILQQVLNTELPVSKTENFFFERYDPTNDDHQKYEIPKSEKFAEVEKKANNERKEKQAEVEEKAPAVSTEKFYEVDESLSNLFGSSNQGTNGFSFLSVDENPEEEKNVENTVGIEVPMKEVRWKVALDRPAVQEDDMTEDNKSNEETLVESKGWKIFFSDDDERFELGRNFVRTQDIDDITNEWNNIRSNLHQDYKKKHKDALRRVRKLKERKFSRK